MSKRKPPSSRGKQAGSATGAHNALRAAAGKVRRGKRARDRAETAPAQDQAVGYGRPPRESQFKPGQSGNPKGRPKGKRSLSTIVDEVLAERVTITRRNGRTAKVSKLQAMLLMAVNKALQGDHRFVGLVMNLAQPKAAAAEADERRAGPSETRALFEKLNQIRDVLDE